MPSVKTIKVLQDPTEGLKTNPEKLAAVQKYMEEMHYAFSKDGSGVTFVAVLDLPNGKIRLAHAKTLDVLERYINETNLGENYKTVSIIQVNTRH
jgi:hypothetical protein